jgi:hypothetical protein
VSAIAQPPAAQPVLPRARRWAPPAWTITAALGLIYVIAAPPSSDLAAAGYRSDLFARAGFTLWDNGWYAGHHLLAYSLLAPGLGSLLGPQLLTALAATLATALFAALVAERFPARAARLAALWFAVGVSVELLTNRVAFDLGLALGLGSLLLAARSCSRTSAHRAGARRALAASALALAVLCALASPVAGAFLALTALAWMLAETVGGGRGAVSRSDGDGRAGGRWTSAMGARGLALPLVVAALTPVALLAIAFPEGGTQPFVASAFYPALAVVLLIAAAIPPQQRVLRTGTLLYALVLIGAYAIPTAVGGNADRLGALVAGPVLALALAGAGGAAGRRWWALLALAPLLLYWQVRAPIADFATAASDQSTERSYYQPLLRELRELGIGYGARPARIEVVATRNHAEARWVADRVAIARGWERQLDVGRNGLFYARSRSLGAARYGVWLSEEAVSYVALPDATLDYSARAEARVVRSAPGYLREVWRSRHWRLFAVVAARPLAQPPSTLARLGSDWFTLRTPAAGTYTVRVRFTPYWELASGHGCVRRGPGDWTQVQTRGAGSVRVAIGFSLARMFAHGPRCR